MTILSTASSSTFTIRNTENPTDNTDSLLGSHAGIALIAGIVGGLAVVIIILCSSVVIVIVKFQRQRLKKMSIAEYKDSGNMYSNAIYMKGQVKLGLIHFYFMQSCFILDNTSNGTLDDQDGFQNPAYDYANTGPRRRISTSKEELADDYEVLAEYPFDNCL